MTRYLFALLLCLPFTAFSQELMNPVSTADLEYDQLLLTGEYDSSVPHPDEFLGFAIGQKAASAEQITEAVLAIAEASERVLPFEYARSHEGRPLHYFVVSSPANLDRIDAIKGDLAELADPRNLTKPQANQIIESLPAVAWMSYSIHGNESSGADAAVVALYHLAADKSADTDALLDGMVVIIDPMQNPDGRARFVKHLQEARSRTPNVDDQSRLHWESWPRGRGNHYYFDLNRDYIYGTQPETRGKVAAINSWYPQLVIDGHEMGPQEDYHFTPSREPVNFNLSPRLRRWNQVFGEDHSHAFDEQAWPWFNGELFDDLYPGYTTYSQYRGALNILYEQARLAENGVRQHNGRIETYKNAVHRQLISTMVNLESLSQHSKAIYRDYVMDRREVLAASSPYANRTFVVLPTNNRSRMAELVASLELQGFELYQADADIDVRNALQQSGETLGRATIPKGSLVIPNRQPEARLLATMLEFDTGILEETLRKERESLLRGEGSISYDDTGWNLTMLYGLEAWTIPTHLQDKLSAYNASAVSIDVREGALGYLVEGDDDHSVSFAARAMESGLLVRVLTRPTEFEGRSVSRGSVVVYRNDNRQYGSSLHESVSGLATSLDVSVRSFDSGLGTGELPDIGGRYVALLSQPRLAIVYQRGVDTTDYGTIWHSVDRYLGVRHSHLELANLGRVDLRRYNVIVIPDVHIGALPGGAAENLAAWVESGGTLIAVNDAAAIVADPKSKLTKSRTIEHSFAKAAEYDLQLQREWLARNTQVDMTALASNTAPESVPYPWPSGGSEQAVASEAELKKRDAWQKIFMPQGALLAGSTDQKHWLTFGSDEVLPVRYGQGRVLMVPGGAEAAVRMGELSKMSDSRWKAAQAELEESGGARSIGWASLPDEYELRLRMSGLLWPEAAQRIANSAYLVRERKGAGQVILFADRPIYRAAALGSNRMLLNAIVYGPGLGARTPIIP